jgi:hypothetical protein
MAHKAPIVVRGALPSGIVMVNSAARRFEESDALMADRLKAAARGAAGPLKKGAKK